MRLFTPAAIGVIVASSAALAQVAGTPTEQKVPAGQTAPGNDMAGPGNETAPDGAAVAAPDPDGTAARAPASAAPANTTAPAPAPALGGAFTPASPPAKAPSTEQRRR